MILSKEQLEKFVAEIEPLDDGIMDAAQYRLDHLTKPRGSLGRLESMARRVCGIRKSLTPVLKNKMILTFAGDHGVVEEGVSSVPQEVTRQMVYNFLAGGAGVNVLARHVGAEVRVIDVGVAVPLDAEGLFCHKVKHGTDNMMKGPAMTEEEALAAVAVGMECGAKAISDGAQILGTGEMGIGNTTPSAALFAVLLELDVSDVTGRGTGVDDKTLNHKIDVIRRSLEINRKRLHSPLETLAAVGGLEIAAICGMILEAARRRVPVVVDGFISSAGALVAMKLNRIVLDYCFFSHLSAEQGHRHFFTTTGLKPILHLDMRLGEGTGAALAMELIESSVKIITEMATFDEAGVNA
ncbi:MAG: nicotinate-nucleotide--dimethylbenzimidazole phosphoribosyltransferase [Thermodesulfobacteriota bacterium]|nr:nicotinate-nucleotide--dimethylbenzimidazole phosphoribosyltransferase [Thermodesulfobacteriota bacterium]